MKTKSLSIFLLLSIVFSIFTFNSCNSTKVEEKDPYFLADMNAIYLDEILALNKQNFFKPKPVTINAYFYPRTSCVAFCFKDGMNKVMLTFSPEEYKSLCDSVNKYVAIFDADEFVKNYKPTGKNYLSKGHVSNAWGTTGYSREVNARYTTNYQWVEVNGQTNPYFRIEVPAATYPQEEHVGSPFVTLYFTPSQAKSIVSVVDMEAIMQQINDYNDAVYNFE